MTDPMAPTSATSSALARATPAPPPADISSGVFSGIAAFEAAQRMAQALCTSTMVPSDYRGQQGLSNSLIALEIAARMGLSPLVVMQNMTPIHGKPSWSSSFLIATVNASGRFTPLRFVFDDKDNPSSCYAVARDKATGEVLEGQMISIEMAKREGWWSRPDRYGKETSKWQSMTGQMLRYRAAAFWVKVYCPEISLGLMTQEEVGDVQAVEVAAMEPHATTSALPAPAIPVPLERTVQTSTPGAAAATQADRHEAPRPSKAAATQAGTAGEVQEAQAPRRSPRRPATTQRRSEEPTETDRDETPAGESAAQSEGAAAETSRSPRPTEAPPQPAAAKPAAPEQAGGGGEQPELATSTAAEPAPVATAQPTAAELLTTALQEIPKLASPDALDRCRQRVSRLLAEGRITDEGAERLWSAIDRRLQQLQTTDPAPAAAQVS